MAKFIRKYYPGKRHEDEDKPMSLGECQREVGGYVETHVYAGLTLVCDDEGVLKRYDPCMCVDGCVYRGTILVGRFADEGLLPVTEEEIAEFENHITIRF